MARKNVRRERENDAMKWAREIFKKQFSPSRAASAMESSAEELSEVGKVQRTAVFRSMATPWSKWYKAFKQVWPVYLAAHLAVLLIDCLAVLFTYTRPYQSFGTYYQQVPTPKLSTLWDAWNIWPHDTPHFLEIARQGYDHAWLTAFFPLYPLLIRIVTPLTADHALIAALLVANLAGLVMLVVFYQLVKEDFDHVRAMRTVLYFSLFPTAFFFMAGYSETTFLCCALLCFYHMRRGRWWLAGLFGLLAALTRNTGIVLFVPFAYEYLRQHHFQLGNMRLNALSALLIPLGLGLFMAYCYALYRDPLAFQHAEVVWHHVLVLPWIGILGPIRTMIRVHSLLSFVVERNSIELGSAFFILLLLMLSLFGPWRFPRTHLAYILFAVIVWVIPLCSPVGSPDGSLPYQSVARYMLEVFPAFIVLAALGKFRMVHSVYLMVAGALFFFLLTQFLLGYLII